MFGLKYIVNNTVEVDPDAALYTKLPIAQGKFTAYENNYALPIAFRVNDTVQSWATDGSDPFWCSRNSSKRPPAAAHCSIR